MLGHTGVLSHKKLTWLQMKETVDEKLFCRRVGLGAFFFITVQFKSQRQPTPSSHHLCLLLFQQVSTYITDWSNTPFCTPIRNLQLHWITKIIHYCQAVSFKKNQVPQILPWHAISFEFIWIPQIAVRRGWPHHVALIHIASPISQVGGKIKDEPTGLLEFSIYIAT